MTFDEWFHKEYEPADLQIKQYAERKEGLHIPATCYLEDLKKAFEAGLHSDVHTDNSKVIAELNDEVHTWKEASSTNSYKSFQLQEENKTLSKHIVELQNDKGDLTDKCKQLEEENERFKGDLELWESGACRATNLDKCGVVKELEAQIEKMKSALERWYKQHSDKTYTETFYADLITDTEILLWRNCEK